ncbi:Ig-like domain-containing protein [Sediminicola luteus]|uniref:Ig-like domain-containing protein n=1 Tax=Sediminicola luteus TaxID=319238 RepID=A0ABV2TU52_9FLAO
MKIKIILLLLINMVCYDQLYAQCTGVDFEEKNGIAILEMESKLAGSWKKESIPGASANSALAYRGNDSFGNPNNSIISYSVRINSPGTYRFIWRNKIGIIASTKPTTEHNDSWLKINGSDFYGLKGTHKVYPGGSGKSPVANGTTSGGYFKIYTSTIDWNWTALTSDNDGHVIYTTFNQAGVYSIQVGGRSSGHMIDRMVLYKESNYSAAQAQNLSNAQTNCSGGSTPPTDPTPPTGGNKAPTVSFTTITNGQNFSVGSNLSIGLSASDSDGSISKHEIYVNNSLVDTDGSSYTPHQLNQLSAGNYSVKATVTDNRGASTSATVNFTVGGSSPPPPDPTPPAGGNKAPSVNFTTLVDGQQVTVGSTVSIGVSASDSDGSITKHQIFVNGSLVDTDGSNFTPHNIVGISAGNHEIKAIVTDNLEATASKTINITAGSGQPSNPSNPSTPTISFDLVNSTTNSTISSISNGTTLSSNNSKGVNIRANAPTNTKSVVFKLTGALSRNWTESFAPYALFGDTNGNYSSNNLPVGSYNLNAVAYSGGSGSGSVIANTTIVFNVGNSSSTTAKTLAYPNPVKSDGRISLKLPEGTSGSYTYSVTNSLGIQLEQGRFTANPTQTEVDLQLSNIGKQTKGVYYLSIISSNSKQTIPIIRE